VIGSLREEQDMWRQETSSYFLDDPLILECSLERAARMQIHDRPIAEQSASSFFEKTIFQKINANKIDHLCASLRGGKNCFQARWRGILAKPMVATPVFIR